MVTINPLSTSISKFIKSPTTGTAGSATGGGGRKGGGSADKDGRTKASATGESGGSGTDTSRFDSTGISDYLSTGSASGTTERKVIKRTSRFFKCDNSWPITAFSSSLVSSLIIPSVTQTLPSFRDLPKAKALGR